MGEASIAGTFGAFGKIPVLGDFLRLNLPADFIKSWDTWLQAGMVAARTSLGAHWDACYLSAPIWRFSLPAGLAGKHAVSGILMASVDRVGRQYPLTLATTCQPRDTALRHFANSTLFEHLEEIALATLDQDAGRDEIAEALASLSLAAPEPRKCTETVYCGSAMPEHVLAAKRIEQNLGDVGIWTARLGDGNRMLLDPGLPDAMGMANLLNMNAPIWQENPGFETA